MIYAGVKLVNDKKWYCLKKLKQKNKSWMGNKARSINKENAKTSKRT